MKYVIALMVFVLLQISSYAETYNLDYAYMDKVNKERMNLKERFRVERFSNNWVNQNKNNPKETIFTNAIFEIMNITEYQSEGKKPSDVLKGLANCQGYSTMLQILLTKCGIETEVMVSKTHMWNRVKLDGKWLTMDITSFDSFSNGKEFKYGN